MQKSKIKIQNDNAKSKMKNTKYEARNKIKIQKGKYEARNPKQINIFGVKPLFFT